MKLKSAVPVLGSYHRFTFVVPLALAFGFSSAKIQAAEQFWRTDGASAIWTGVNWNSTGTGLFDTAYTANNDAHFTANSQVTFATVSIGNVSVDAGMTVTVAQAGTLSMNGTVRTFDIGTGALLDWRTQQVSANSAAGITKNGTGTLRLDALTFTTNMNGGFTLNAGTVIVTGDKALGNGALNLNGGTLQSSGTIAFAPTSITVGGDFALGGSGNARWDAATSVALGSSTRIITNNTASGSRQFRGLISGSSGAGLAFAGTGGAQIYVGNTGNSFSGPVSIAGGEVVFNGDGALGTGTSVVIDGGRLTMAGMGTDGSNSALSSATISASRTISVGDGAGTSIKVEGASGVTTFNGSIANVSGETGAWAKDGGGTLKLGGVSSYTGATAIINGTLQMTTGNNRLPTGTALTIGSSGQSAMLDLGDGTASFDQQVAGLTTAGTAANQTITNTSSGTGTATLTVNNDATTTNADFTFAGIIKDGSTAKVALTKAGSKTLTISGANTYTGGTSINGGTLKVGGSGNILADTGAVTLGGGTLDINNFDETVGAVALNSGSIINSGATATKALTVASLSAQSGSISAVIAGTGTFSKSTAGTVALSGANTYSGTTTISHGTLSTNSIVVSAGSSGLGNATSAVTLGDASNKGTLSYTGNDASYTRGLTINAGGGQVDVVTSGRTLTMNTDLALGGLFTVGGAGNTTLGGIVSSTGGVTKSGAGTLTFSGASANTYAGLTTVSGGTLTLAKSAGIDAIAGDLMISGGTVDFNSSSNNQIKDTSSVTLGSGSFELSARTEIINSLTMTGGALARGGAVLTANGASSITGGTLAFSSSSDSSIVFGSTLALGGAALNYSPSGAATTNTVQLGGNVTFAASQTAAATFNNTGGGTGRLSLGGVTRSFDIADSTTLGSGVAEVQIAWSVQNGGLTKSGTGALSLSGTNTYTGVTQINGGKLIVGNGTSGSLANTAVTVGGAAASNTPTLGGSGTIGGATIIAAAGVGAAGTHAPGVTGVNSGVGKQTFSSTLRYETGSIFEWDLNGNTLGNRGVADGFDAVDGAGALTVNAGAIFRIVLGSGVVLTNDFWDTPFITQTWSNIFSGFSGVTGSFTNANLQVTGQDVSGYGTFTISGTSLTWTAVPEPTSAVVGILLGAGLLRRRRVG